MIEKYTNFIYHSYQILFDEAKIYFKYEFEIEGLSKFNPEIEILKKDFKWNNLKSNILENIVFNLGIVESISYFKVTCSKNFIIKCGALEKEQELWFRKLFYLGLSEFRYRNKINTSEENFINFISLGKKIKIDVNENKLNGILIPIGGGKDSCVTLEIVKNNNFNEINTFRIGMNDVVLKCVQIAGLERNNIIEVNRKIDKNLLKLNKEGFLNGHTPFSAIVAFLSYAISYMLNKKYIILSNENSANETNVIGENINHQYSKTIEFENDFRFYSKKYLRTNIEYFSFLRPISELQIAMIFSKFEKYHQIFKSCNVGSKNEPWVWCGNCPKCLFVYIILSAFLEEKKLIKIFNKNLFEEKKLIEIFIQLCGYGDIKPFECVGTFEEVRFCVNINIEKRNDQKLPFLLNYYKEHYNLEKTNSNILKKFSLNNNLPIEFENILKEKILI